MANQRLIFFGTDEFSAVSLAALLEHGFDVVAVISRPDRRRGRGRQLEEPPVKRLAARHNRPVWQPERLADIADELTSLDAPAGVVVAYGQIIPPAIIDQFPIGLVNVHASLLPAYRGASPIESALLAGDAQTGVTLMRIDVGLDTGPIYAQTPLPLTGQETRPELTDRLARLGAALLVEYLPSILERRLAPVPQAESGASLTRRLTKVAGGLDCQKSATELERQVRAFLGWPGSRLQIGAETVVVTAAHVGDTEPFAGADQTGAAVCTPFTTARGELAVTTSRGELIIDRLIPPGKREMTGAAYLAGHPLASTY